MQGFRLVVAEAFTLLGSYEALSRSMLVAVSDQCFGPVFKNHAVQVHGTYMLSQNAGNRENNPQKKLDCLDP